jgi:hypothetical protein
LLGFFIFRILLLKIPFQRAHTLVFKQMNGRAIFKNLSKFSRGPSLKNNKKKVSAGTTNDFDQTFSNKRSLIIYKKFKFSLNGWSVEVFEKRRKFE